MTTSQAPPTLASFFVESPALLPVPVKSRLARHPLLARLRLRIARYYWRQRDPLVYLKCLCSETTSQLTTTLQIGLPSIVVAAASCRALSNEFRSAAMAAAAGQPMSRFLTRFVQSQPAYIWSEGQDVTQAVRAHVSFIWACTMAAASDNLARDDVTNESITAIKGCVSSWIEYLESIFAIQCT